METGGVVQASAFFRLDESFSSAPHYERSELQQVLDVKWHYATTTPVHLYHHPCQSKVDWRILRCKETASRLCQVWTIRPSIYLSGGAIAVAALLTVASAVESITHLYFIVYKWSFHQTNYSWFSFTHMPHEIQFSICVKMIAYLTL